MKYILIVLMVFITSGFYFPFEFAFLPGLNTKQILAGLGFIFMVYHMTQMEKISISREVAIASVIAIIFSAIGLFSVDYNYSDDYSYATYIVSMWVWFSASYAVVTLMSFLHGYLSYKLVINYLIAACLIQCVFALAIDFNPTFKAFADAYFITGDREFMEEVKRLYGIGASLDAAGIRFAAVLIMIAVLIAKDNEVRHNQKLMTIYFISFLIITVIGNMISRTTSVGLFISVIYLLFALNVFKASVSVVTLRVWKIILLSIVLVLPIAIYFYNTNEGVYKLMRFAFEGFFNYVEKGVWETDSTNRLNQAMWIWPADNDTKTWIIGKAVFSDWGAVGTDIGYCRFVFYCGLTGLCTFILFFAYLSYALWKKFPKINHLFLLLFFLALINWIKVSTDIFLIYAIFLALSSPYLSNFYIESRENENSI
ncbi:hypothetical protein [Elizabethkingia ursingii]|uniref:O-antigen ligase domain-containing protein n=1 Tax=Elizabethkingia ursingii TaxID=1756150 RepID=A0AAJ3NAF2_9FLAO|nr:hypothetical protein [Elizabethkingia ursingii]AQX08230.1 hypothetical protein BBD34_06030 [Elizabethkingia ursingii]OPB73414.1 hypothetical protein BAY32_10190 [Elizabethkingia ursingii]